MPQCRCQDLLAVDQVCVCCFCQQYVKTGCCTSFFQEGSEFSLWCRIVICSQYGVRECVLAGERTMRPTMVPRTPLNDSYSYRIQTEQRSYTILINKVLLIMFSAGAVILQKRIVKNVSGWGLGNLITALHIQFLRVRRLQFEPLHFLCESGLCWDNSSCFCLSNLLLAGVW